MFAVENVLLCKIMCYIKQKPGGKCGGQFS